MSQPDVLPRSLLWKRRFGAIWQGMPGGPNRRVILIYHAVGSGPQSLSVDHFSQQLEWLHTHARVESLDSLLENTDSNGLHVALTFDDGYQSVAEVAAPLMAEYGFSGTVYLTSGEISEQEPQPARPEVGHLPGEYFLTWDGVRKLKRIGWTIGSHGVDHLDLTTLPESEILYQLAESRRTLAAQVEADCRHFCYTWGRHNKRVQSLVARAGYATAVAAHHQALKSNCSATALPRLCVRENYTLQDFANMLQGNWDFLGIYHKLRRIFER